VSIFLLLLRVSSHVYLPDWTQDATPDKFPKAPVFDPIFGFGGNGPFINKTNPDRSFHITDKTGGGKWAFSVLLWITSVSFTRFLYLLNLSLCNRLR
jgi:hypothetical protein